MKFNTLLKSQCKTLNASHTIKNSILNGSLLILMSIVLGGCNTFSPVKPDFSPFNTHSKTTSKPGDLIWIDILSKDVVEAQAFYHALFGWEYVTNDTGYITIIDNDQAIGGMLIETHVDANSRWMPMFSIADSEQGGKKALELQGRLPTAPVKMTNDLTYAVISDSEGAAFGVMSSPSGISNQAYTSTRKKNAYLWSHDRQQAFRFYQPLFSLKMKSNKTPDIETKKNVPELSIIKAPETKKTQVSESQKNTSMRRIFAPRTEHASPEKDLYKPATVTFGEPNPYKPSGLQFGVDLSMNVIELPWQEISSQWVIAFNVEQADRVLSQVVHNGGCSYWF
ncbi:MAG: hypothetical protein OQL19_00060 [Gammaproteobacteria bacterium]|nr:hypothetical protein [Gammaproteobacteria bacterium]